MPLQGRDNREESHSSSFMGMVGSAETLAAVRAAIEKFAICDAPVLVQGETGTGKELVARMVHYLGARSNNPFVPVNCGALPDNLIENELFGHCAGAYTDARDGQSGLVEQADGGTLFLDEIGTLSARAQCALLRFLQEREYRRLGDRRNRTADVRIVAASNARLSAMAESGTFREDLFYRLNVLSFELPPLRRRTRDIPVLATHFLDTLCRQYDCEQKHLSRETIGWMMAYRWPGNIRELQSLVHRAFILSECREVSIPRAGSLPSLWEVHDGPEVEEQDFQTAKARAIEAFEREYITQRLHETGGNITRAAELSGKERRAFGKLVKKYDIDHNRYRSS